MKLLKISFILVLGLSSTRAVRRWGYSDHEAKPYIPRYSTVSSSSSRYPPGFDPSSGRKFTNGLGGDLVRKYPTTSRSTKESSAASKSTDPASIRTSNTDVIDDARKPNTRQAGSNGAKPSKPAVTNSGGASSVTTSSTHVESPQPAKPVVDTTTPHEEKQKKNQADAANNLEHDGGASLPGAKSTPGVTVVGSKLHDEVKLNTHQAISDGVKPAVTSSGGASSATASPTNVESKPPETPVVNSLPLKSSKDQAGKYITGINQVDGDITLEQLRKLRIRENIPKSSCLSLYDHNEDVSEDVRDALETLFNQKGVRHKFIFNLIKLYTEKLKKYIDIVNEVIAKSNRRDNLKVDYIRKTCFDVQKNVEIIANSISEDNTKEKDIKINELKTIYRLSAEVQDAMLRLILKHSK